MGHVFFFVLPQFGAGKHRWSSMGTAGLTWAIMFLVMLGYGVVALNGTVCRASTASGRVEQSLQEQQRAAKAHEEVLAGLSVQERELFGNLQEVEAKLRKAAATVTQLENELEGLRREEKRIHEEYHRLDAARNQTSDELRELLAVLWPVHVRGFENSVHDLSSWAEADRQFTWLSRVHDLVQNRLDLLRRQGRELALAQSRAEKSAAHIQDQLELVDAAKDEYLTQKLVVLRRVQEVRARKVSTEQQVQEILQTIADLNYQLKALATKKITDFQGQMPWPGQGRLVEGFRPQASPPHPGISLRMGENEPVSAVSWGKVVHSDVLRGFGRVVIVYHGEDYYSLYAFLNEVSVEVGQKVEKDEQIGLAGYYPKVDGPGLYFELRFHQNPVNPERWLVEQKR